MQEPEEETAHPSPVKGRRSLITEQRGAEWLWVGKGGVLVTLTFGARLEMPPLSRTPRQSKVIWNLPQNSQLVQSRQCCCCEQLCGRGCCTLSPQPSCPIPWDKSSSRDEHWGRAGGPWGLHGLMGQEQAELSHSHPLTRVPIRPLPLISVIRFCPWHKHFSQKIDV